KKRRGACIDCGQPAIPGMSRCQPCREKTNTAQREAEKVNVSQGLCAKCPEPLSPRSRRFCVTHHTASREAMSIHRRRRTVNTTGTTLEAEKEARVRRDYGEGGVTAWKRDNACCVLCDVAYADRAVYLHHIDRDRTHNTADNLVCLCYTCHRLVH